MKALNVLSTVLLGALLVGCSGYEVVPPKPGEDNWGPTLPRTNNEPVQADGGLYHNDYMFTLFQDRRAYRVGDILTVTLQESTQSSKRANTSLGKDSSIDFPTPTFGGKTQTNIDASMTGTTDFKGTSSSSQQNTLSGYITVTVSEVLPNGVLHIRGEKWLRLNQGDEYMRLDGLVRIQDIDLQNRISSQRLANAHITYAGRGALSDANQAGWLTRFFNGPLSPF